MKDLPEIQWFLVIQKIAIRSSDIRIIRKKLKWFSLHFDINVHGGS
jgi:hypothetical protein